MYSSTSALLSKYQARISLICETETVGNPSCMSSTVSPTCVRITIVSSVTREFRTRMAPFSNWTRGTASGKLKCFVSTSRILTVFCPPKKTRPRKHFDTTRCKKVFNKQHFLQHLRTKYTDLSFRLRPKAPFPLRLFLIVDSGDSCNDASKRIVRFCFVKFSNSRVPD